MSKSIGCVLYRATPIISVKEARKVLGKSYDKHPDNYIKSLVEGLDAIAETFVNSVPKH